MMLTKDQKIELGVGAGVLGGLGYYYYTKSRQVTHPVTSPIHTVTHTGVSTVTHTQTSIVHGSPVIRTVNRTITNTGTPSSTRVVPNMLLSPPSNAGCPPTIDAGDMNGGFLGSGTPSDLARGAIADAMIQRFVNPATGGMYTSWMVKPTIDFIYRDITTVPYTIGRKLTWQNPPPSSACLATIMRWVDYYFATNPRSLYSYLPQWVGYITPQHPITNVDPRLPMLEPISANMVMRNSSEDQGPVWEILFKQVPFPGTTGYVGPNVEGPIAQLSHAIAVVYNSHGQVIFAAAGPDGHNVAVPGGIPLVYLTYKQIKAGDMVRVVPIQRSRTGWTIGLVSTPITLSSAPPPSRRVTLRTQ